MFQTKLVNFLAGTLPEIFSKGHYFASVGFEQTRQQRQQGALAAARRAMMKVNSAGRICSDKPLMISLRMLPLT